MLTLIGKQYCKVDSNGRFKFPADLKKQLPEGSCNRFVVRESIVSPCLEIWLENDFMEDMKKIRKLNRFNPLQEKLKRKLSEAVGAELDSADRFLIPNGFKKLQNITKEIVLVPVDNIIEIWDAQKYDEVNNDPTIDYAALAYEFLGKDDIEENEKTN